MAANSKKLSYPTKQDDTKWLVLFLFYLKNRYKGTRIIHKGKYIIFFQQNISNKKQYCYAQLRTCAYYIASDAFFLLASHAVIFRFYTILSLEESWDFRNGFAQKVWCSAINMKRLLTCKWNQISNERLCTGSRFQGEARGNSEMA